MEIFQKIGLKGKKTQREGDILSYQYHIKYRLQIVDNKHDFWARTGGALQLIPNLCINYAYFDWWNERLGSL